MTTINRLNLKINPVSSINLLYIAAHKHYSTSVTGEKCIVLKWFISVEIIVGYHFVVDQMSWPCSQRQINCCLWPSHHVFNRSAASASTLHFINIWISIGQTNWIYDNNDNRTSSGNLIKPSWCCVMQSCSNRNNANKCGTALTQQIRRHFFNKL